MSEVLRGASEGDDRQMASPTDERDDDLRRSRSASFCFHWSLR